MSKPKFVFLDSLPASVAEHILEEEALPLECDVVAEKVVMGLTPKRWSQVAEMFAADPGADVLACLGLGFSIQETACLLARSERRVRGIARGFINRLRDEGMPREISMSFSAGGEATVIPAMRRATRAGRPSPSLRRRAGVELQPDMFTEQRLSA